jgi:excisionase family DNA binding protein
MTQLMSVKEVANYFSISQMTIYKYAAQGKIPALRVGRVWRFDKQAIDTWVFGKSNAEGADHGSHE